MGDPEIRKLAEQAVRSLEKAIERGPQAPHQEIADGVEAVIGFRDHLLEKTRAGRAPDWCLREANALVSLAFGAEYPLIGFHLHRLEKTRDGMNSILERCESADARDRQGTHRRSRG